MLPFFSIIGMLYGRVLKIKPGKGRVEHMLKDGKSNTANTCGGHGTADAQRTQKLVQLQRGPCVQYWPGKLTSWRSFRHPCERF